jgi:hypothetical protein
MGGVLKTNKMKFLSIALIIVAIFFLVPSFVHAIGLCQCSSDLQCNRGYICAGVRCSWSGAGNDGMCVKPYCVSDLGGVCKSQDVGCDPATETQTPYSTIDCAPKVCCVTGGDFNDTTGCNNDAKCEPDQGETAANCPFDCAPCNDTKRNSISSCQGDPLVSASQCRWCGVPDNTIYAYKIPNQASDSCVNITNDPFNCGECGFEGGVHVTLTATQTTGVCAGEFPFCADSTCKASSAITPAEQEAVNAYKASHSSLINQYYTPYSVAVVGESFKAPGAAGAVYSEEQVDTSAAACAFGGGDWDSVLGCCGDGKCRVPDKISGGSICHAARICDGTKWHDVSLTSQNGEVFLTPECRTIYPVANINGEFNQCVDEDQFQDYLNWMAKASGACIPSEYLDSVTVPIAHAKSSSDPGVWHKDGAQIPWESIGQYVCPAGTYWTGEEATATGSDGTYDQCRIKPAPIKAGSSGVLVCTAMTKAATASLFGFATMGAGVATGEASNMRPNWFDNPAGSSYYIPLCPAPISVWNGGRGASTIDTILPCPGSVPVTYETGKNTVMVYGSNAPDRYAVFCVADATQKIDSTLNFMGYFRGNGTVMGNVSGHEYACITDSSSTVPVGASKAKVAICCGQQGCDGIPGAIGAGGVKMTVGAELIVSNSTTLYCLADGTWSEDLDYNYTQDTCARKFLATGNYCCAESDDTRTWINESYNDPGSSKGACFKGQQQNNDFLLRYKLKNSTLVTQNNVMIYNGTFMGCGFNITNFSAEMDLNNQTLCDMSRPLSQQCIESIENWPNPGKNFTNQSSLRTNKSLIQNTDYCTMLSTSFGGFYYCAYSNNWADSMGENFSHKSEVPIDLFVFMFNQTVESIDPALKITNLNVSTINLTNLTQISNLTPTNCCLPGQCWDPLAGTCTSEYGATQSYRINESTAYQCLQGVWVSMAEAKRTPDGCYIGICPNVTQCFYNQLGDRQQNNNIAPGANPQCLADGQYIKDNLCMNGSWASRTKMLAQKLVSLVGNNEDFTLMCGPPSVVLNNFRQNLGDSNNFCNLDLGGQRIIGTTLNQPLINTTSHVDFLTALEQSFLSLSYKDMGVGFSHTCTAQTTGFTKCIDISDSTQDYLTLYYDDDYQMVLMSNTDINGLTPNLGDRICNLTPGWLQWLCPSPPELEKNLKDVQLFQKLYAANFSSKSVFGVAEQTCDPTNLKKTNLYTFNYTGFTDVDLRYMINQLEASNTTITPNNVLVLDSKKNIDPWAPMTLLRNPGQQ